MSIYGKDDAYVSAERVVRIDCSVHGQVSISRRAMNDREIDEVLKAHLNEEHGGIFTGLAGPPMSAWSPEPWEL